jgi:hypothetical protein
MTIKRVLFKDKFGNRLVERKKDLSVGVVNKKGQMITPSEFKSWVKENKFGSKIKFKKDGSLWVSNKILGREK